MSSNISGNTESPVKVYARWVGYASGRARSIDHNGRKTHTYSVSIPPERPLQIGMRVSIYATTPAWYLSPEADPDDYEAYDAHIVGLISGVVGWKGRKVILEVSNECAANEVEKARIRLPNVPDVMVQLGEAVIPEGCREAHESDLNTTAVVRTSTADASCSASTCWTPWRRLAGENFLLEPMEEDVGEKAGATGGRRKMEVVLIGWGNTVVDGPFRPAQT
ncbi:hypothetical protein C8T65DRAFT_698844 [Cerioporus squamosus]|nr:hypothetical protein C8T65DRAFT_698844 [Cerioporus squamosus]